MITIQELLVEKGLDGSKRIKLARHPNRQLFDNQSHQKEATFHDKKTGETLDYLVSFVGEKGRAAKFGGIYRVLSFVENPDSVDSRYVYQLEEVPGFDDLKDSVVIKWGHSTNAWHQYFDKKKEVIPADELALYENTIILEKGEKVPLEKDDGNKLTEFCVGVNWGAITYEVEEYHNILWFCKKKVRKTLNVDLDLSCVMYNSAKELCDCIYSPLYKPASLEPYGLQPGKLVSLGGALRHSGDDTQGDVGDDDGLDNEIIAVNLSLLDPKVTQIVFFLNSVGREGFSHIPYVKIRMYEGTPSEVVSVYAENNLIAESQFRGKHALVMGKLSKTGRGSNWHFTAIGEAFDDRFIGDTIKRIEKTFI